MQLIILPLKLTIYFKQYSHTFDSVLSGYQLILMGYNFMYWPESRANQYFYKTLNALICI